MLSPHALSERASGVSGSFEMLALAPASLYARRVIIESNRELRSARALSRGWQELRWAWLVDGAARWFSGESGYSRSVLGRYLRAGHRPHFPPRAHDAPLLGATADRAARRAAGRRRRCAACQHGCTSGGARHRARGRVLGSWARRPSRPNGAHGCADWRTADNLAWPTTRNSPTASASCCCSSPTSSRSGCSAGSRS